MNRSLAEVEVPGVVGGAVDHEPLAVGRPARVAELELARRQVARRRRPVGRHDPDVLRPVDHPALVVQPAEEPGDATRRLALRVVARRSGRCGPGAEKASQRPSGDHARPPMPSGKRGQRDRLAAAGDRVARAACSFVLAGASVNARRRPSGDQHGLPSPCSPLRERLGRRGAVGGGQPDLAAVAVLRPRRPG